MANFIGTSASEIFDGTGGEDTAIGNGGNDTLNGNGGDDTLHINGSGTSTAVGGTGSDTLIAEGGGAKSLFGEADDDHLYVGGGSAAAYAIHGGDGFDTLGLYGVTTINLSSTSITGVEAFVGTTSNDTITLDLGTFTGFSTFDGDAGTDTVKLRSIGDWDVSDVTTGAWFSLENVETLEVLGGSGDDQLDVSVHQFAEVDLFNLGQGSDVLHVETTGDVDLTTRFPDLSGVETLTLTGTGSVRMALAQYAKFTSIDSDISVTVAGTGARLQLYTPAQLADMAGRVDLLDATDDVLALSVAQFRALGPISLTADDVVTLADTGANLATLTAAELAAAAAAGIDKINATDNALTLTKAQALALGAMTLTATDVVVVEDSGGQLTNLTPAQIADLRLKGVDRLDSNTDTLSLTVAGYDALQGIALTANDMVVLRDSGIYVSLLTASAIAALGAAGIDRINASDDALTLTVAQYHALGGVALTPADYVILGDTSANLATLTPAQFTGLSTKGVDRLDAIDDTLTLTKAQALALGATTLAAGDMVVVEDSGGQLTNLTPAQIADLRTKGVDRLDSNTDSLSLTVAGYDALQSIALTANDMVVLRDSGANISALTASAIAALGAAGIDRINASDDLLTLTVAQYRALGGVALTPADHVILTDTPANLATLTPAENAALAGKGIDEVLVAGSATIETKKSSYTLDAFASNLKFIGTGPFSGTGNALDNVITGGDSNDTLRGLGGNDALVGGNGDDLLIGGLGGDILNGGAGIGDYASYINATTGVTASLIYSLVNTGEAAGDTYISIERLEGSSFNDTLIGDDGNNTLRGGAGADILNGSFGSDYASYTTATTGLTASLANPGINTGDAAGDTYISIESLSGSNYGDILIGDASNNTFQGNLGADHIDGGGGLDYASYFNATTGVTASLANAGINTGEAAGDTYANIEGLTGSAFADILIGDGFSHWLIGGGGADQLDGGAGSDTAGYGNSTVGLTASLLDPSANTGEAAGDVYISIEGLSGSSFNDILIGNAGNNGLSGGEGNDGLIGGDGNDDLYGGTGDDNLDGGIGDDYLNGGDGHDTLVGGAGDDTLFGGDGQDTMNGGDGNDTINGEQGNDTVNGGGGDDTILGGTANDILFGDDGNDHINGGSANDTVNGGSGSDTLYGGDDNDIVVGGDGNDQLFGDGGLDIVRGGLGADRLTGGTSADTFDFDSIAESTVAEAGRDVILDFKQAQADRIDLADIDANTTVAGNQAFTFIAGAAFSGTAGELRYAASGGSTLVMGDIDGDATADFSIRVGDNILFNAGDFIL